MPNFEDFELDLKKVKTNSSEVRGVSGTVEKISEKICSDISQSMIEKSIEYNCSVRNCPSGGGCSAGDMTAACYAADKVICRC